MDRSILRPTRSYGRIPRAGHSRWRVTQTSGLLGQKISLKHRHAKKENVNSGPGPGSYNLKSSWKTNSIKWNSRSKSRIDKKLKRSKSADAAVKVANADDIVKAWKKIHKNERRGGVILSRPKSVPMQPIDNIPGPLKYKPYRAFTARRSPTIRFAGRYQLGSAFENRLGKDSPGPAYKLQSTIGKSQNVASFKGKWRRGGRVGGTPMNVGPNKYRIPSDQKLCKLLSGRFNKRFQMSKTGSTKRSK